MWIPGVGQRRSERGADPTLYYTQIARRWPRKGAFSTPRDAPPSRAAVSAGRSIRHHYGHTPDLKKGGNRVQKALGQNAFDFAEQSPQLAGE
eukprot:1799620-Rhodomonas_salina.1